MPHPRRPAPRISPIFLALLAAAVGGAVLASVGSLAAARAGTVLVVLGWLAAELLVFSRLRMTIYDSGYTEPDEVAK